MFYFKDIGLNIYLYKKKGKKKQKNKIFIC